MPSDLVAASDAKPPRKQKARTRRTYKRVRHTGFSVDKLPVKHRDWVREQLADNRLTQVAILETLHERLEADGIKKRISTSAMSNYAKWVAGNGGAIAMVRELAGIHKDHLGADRTSDVEDYLGELIRAAVAKSVAAISKEEVPDLAQLRDAATAIYRLARARAQTQQTRKKIGDEFAANIDKALVERGVPAVQIEAFKAMIGVPHKLPENYPETLRQMGVPEDKITEVMEAEDDDTAE